MKIKLFYGRDGKAPKLSEFEGTLVEFKAMTEGGYIRPMPRKKEE